MKTLALVLVDPARSAAGLEAAVRAALEPHRIDEEDIESIRREGDGDSP